MTKIVWEKTKPSKKGLQSVPSTIGVYVFRHKDDYIYIGKSINLKARLQSHLNSASLDEREAAIFAESNALEYAIADSEFKALLLESKLIQKYMPKYNRIWKDDRSYLYIKVPISDEFPLVSTTRRENNQGSLYFGPFPSVRIAEEILKSIRRVVPFCRQKSIGKYACFYNKLGLCSPCPSKIVKLPKGKERTMLKRQYRSQIRKLTNILEGDTDKVLKHLYRQLNTFSNTQQYEKAVKLRNKIYRFEEFLKYRTFSRNEPLIYNRSQKSLASLAELLEPYIPKLDNLNRIECYDVSNLTGKQATASMVVLTDGIVDKSQYRKFKIKNINARSDFDMLEEAIKRRLKQSWKRPNLVVVDGGKPQVERISALFTQEQLSVPLIGIAKNPDRLVIHSDEIITLKPGYDNLGMNLIRQIRDESHRFARNYHLLLRKKSLKI